VQRQRLSARPHAFDHVDDQLEALLPGEAADADDAVDARLPRHLGKGASGRRVEDLDRRLVMDAAVELADPGGIDQRPIDPDPSQVGAADAHRRIAIESHRQRSMMERRHLGRLEGQEARIVDVLEAASAEVVLARGADQEIVAGRQEAGVSDEDAVLQQRQRQPGCGEDAPEQRRPLAPFEIAGGQVRAEHVVDRREVGPPPAQQGDLVLAPERSEDPRGDAVAAAGGGQQRVDDEHARHRRAARRQSTASAGGVG
jgi:hypothetical protein